MVLANFAKLCLSGENRYYFDVFLFRPFSHEVFALKCRCPGIYRPIWCTLACEKIRAIARAEMAHEHIFQVPSIFAVRLRVLVIFP